MWHSISHNWSRASQPEKMRSTSSALWLFSNRTVTNKETKYSLGVKIIYHKGLHKPDLDNWYTRISSNRRRMSQCSLNCDRYDDIRCCVTLNHTVNNFIKFHRNQLEFDLRYFQSTLIKTSPRVVRFYSVTKDFMSFLSTYVSVCIAWIELCASSLPHLVYPRAVKITNFSGGKLHTFIPCYPCHRWQTLMLVGVFCSVRIGMHFVLCRP